MSLFENFHIDSIKDTCSLADSDLFSVPPVCKDLVDSVYVEIPVSQSALSNSCNQPLEFIYKGTPSVYYDLKNSQIHMTAVMEHKDGTPIVPWDARAKTGDSAGPVNLLSKFFSRIDLDFVI